MEQHSKHQIVPIDVHQTSSVNSKISEDEFLPQQEEEEKQIPSVWFCQLFRFATGFDIFLMVLGTIGAVGLGAAMPAFAYIWGQMTDSFDDAEQMVSSSRKTMFLFIQIGAGALIAGWMMFGGWMIAGERQAIACRKAYLRSLLRQQIGWFDSINQTELASNFAADTFAYQGAIGEKVSTMIMALASVISGFVFAFISGWLMTLVVLSVVPALGIAGVIYISAIMGKDKRQKVNYAKAGGKAAQAITGIKTVKQLGGQQFEVAQYQKCLERVSKQSLKFSIYLGLGVGSIFLVMLLAYSLGFWYGSRCIMQSSNCPENVSKQTYTAGDVLVVFFSVLIGGFNLSQFSPSLQKIAQGQQAAARIFEIIDRQPEIVNPPNGIKLENMKGIIKFENVTFCYPKDKERKVLSNLNLELDVNKTGLVGESGCGKSTIMQLIMRFYDPNEGKVTLDGHDLKEIDLEWLRKQIGYVGQEPVLFATTIKENLLFGNQGSTDAQIEQALRQAEAYDFIQELEEKVDTYVGYGGGQLSGGQKQRIAIARAILRNPRILLLDEATSALDRRNEKVIQNTLDRISQGRTTITIAHRVKTIMNSDIIYVLDKGGIVEKGKFNQISRFKKMKIEEEENVQEEMVEKVEKQKKSFKKVEGQEEALQTEENLNGKKEKVDDTFKTKEEIEAEKQKQLVTKYEEAIFGRLFAYSSGKMCLFFFGIIAALANGVIFPIFSIFLARMLTVLLQLQTDKEFDQKHDEDNLNEVRLYSILFLVFGIASFILTTIQTACFTYVGQQITKRIRIDTYRKILKMPIAWFDIPRNNGGSLAARLSTDCQLVNTVTTSTVSIGVQNVSTLISGIVIALVFQWRTALVALGMMPFMIISGLIEMSLQTGFSDKTDEAYKDSSHLIMEAMINIRTVSSFGTENFVIRRYDEKMQVPYGVGVTKGHVSGLLYGFSQFIMFTIFGVLFFIGALFVRDHQKVEVEDMFIAIYAIVFAGMTAGNNAHFMPDAAACSNAAANLFQIQDSRDQQQQQEEEKSKMLTDNIEGDIELKDVSFKYESRSEYVFKNMSLKIPLGKKVAFVGASGCGKSTIIQLLQRFYEPQSGQITINGINIKDFDIKYLRKTFGVVSQEPVLFLGSFRDNIRYNIDKATEEQIIQAAKKSNAYNFILGNEELKQEGQDSQKKKNNSKGMGRNVGVGGSHISGGQKQRVAIARTILREPKKLLLDEATSALDAENQKIVQEALDTLMEGRTVISIAHRIDTIKNSDEIFMFEKGKIVESGDYTTLINKKGHFYNLERGASFV